MDAKLKAKFARTNRSGIEVYSIDHSPMSGVKTIATAFDRSSPNQSQEFTRPIDSPAHADGDNSRDLVQASTFFERVNSFASAIRTRFPERATSFYSLPLIERNRALSDIDLIFALSSQHYQFIGQLLALIDDHNQDWRHNRCNTEIGFLDYLIVGGQGSGKTTLLRQIQKHIANHVLSFDIASTNSPLPRIANIFPAMVVQCAPGDDLKRVAIAITASCSLMPDSRKIDLDSLATLKVDSCLAEMSRILRGNNVRLIMLDDIGNIFLRLNSASMALARLTATLQRQGIIVIGTATTHAVPRALKNQLLGVTKNRPLTLSPQDDSPFLHSLMRQVWRCRISHQSVETMPSFLEHRLIELSKADIRTIRLVAQALFMAMAREDELFAPSAESLKTVANELLGDPATDSRPIDLALNGSSGELLARTRPRLSGKLSELLDERARAVSETSERRRKSYRQRR